ncbi:MAG: hypothetical protein ABIK44_03800 [candidate division WOR-3 bacterium]
MRKFKVESPKSVRLGLALLLVAAGLTAALARSATPPPAGRRIYDMKWLNINRWLCPFYNDGRYGIDITRGSGVAGGSWPQPLRNEYIFGAGLWFGSLKPRADGKVDTLVTFGYNPNSGGTEMTPTSAAHAASGAGDPNDRIFVYPGDWPPRPRDYFVYTPELESLVPIENFSLQDMWCVYSDLDEANHIAPGKPQGIEIYQTVYAWNYPANQDIFFIIYQVRNAGSDTLKKCYMGAVMDADIGDATDDMVGLLLNDTVPGVGLVKNVGFAGDYNNNESPSSTWQSGTPGVFAYKFLESPRKPAPDTGKLGMTSFKKFTIDIDPVTDPAQYLTMAGFDYRTGVYSPYDSVDISAADKRFIQCSGPFDLAPGQVERLIVAAIAAPFGGPDQPWPDRLAGGKDSLVHLAKVANTAQFIYDQGWLLPGPPPSPNITLVPGDNQVRIVWDNLPETQPDKYWEKVARFPGPGYDPKYRGYDFEGYMVYKSKDGIDWQLIGQCDVRDNFPTGSGADTIWRYPVGGDSTLADSLWIQMRNSGVYYNLVDKNVINGFTYYYCVTAYDYNFITDSIVGNDTFYHPLILRSGIVSNYSTIPRWDAPNYVMPQCSIRLIAGAQTNNGLACSTSVVVPAQVTSDTYELRFFEPEYLANDRSGYKYRVTNLTRDTVVVDTQRFSYTITAAGTKSTVYVPVFNGQQLKLVLKIAGPTVAFDAVKVVRGAYPFDSLKVGAAPTQAWWAFRGSDFRIIWENNGGYLTAKVYDLTNGNIEVPYSPFKTTDMARANGWCIGDKRLNPSDTLKPSSAFLYICGGYLQFRPGRLTDTLGPLLGSIQAGDTWELVGCRAGGAAPFYNVYHIVSTPGWTDSTTRLKLNVRVVPNPYIVFDQWEKTTEQRVLKFTHLPSFCTIRIFTTAGDLVKVIEHKDTKAQPLDQSGTETWDLLNDNQQLIAPGIYVFHVESPVGEFTGKFAFIH